MEITNDFMIWAADSTEKLSIQGAEYTYTARRRKALELYLKIWLQRIPLLRLESTSSLFPLKRALHAWQEWGLKRGYLRNRFGLIKRNRKKKCLMKIFGAWIISASKMQRANQTGNYLWQQLSHRKKLRYFKLWEKLCHEQVTSRETTRYLIQLVYFREWEKSTRIFVRAARIETAKRIKILASAFNAWRTDFKGIRQDRCVTPDRIRRRFIILWMSKCKRRKLNDATVAQHRHLSNRILLKAIFQPWCVRAFRSLEVTRLLLPRLRDRRGGAYHSAIAGAKALGILVISWRIKLALRVSLQLWLSFADSSHRFRYFDKPDTSVRTRCYLIRWLRRCTQVRALKSLNTSTERQRSERVYHDAISMWCARLPQMRKDFVKQTQPVISAEMEYTADTSIYGITIIFKGTQPLPTLAIPPIKVLFQRWKRRSMVYSNLRCRSDVIRARRRASLQCQVLGAWVVRTTTHAHIRAIGMRLKKRQRGRMLWAVYFAWTYMRHRSILLKGNRRDDLRNELHLSQQAVEFFNSYILPKAECEANIDTPKTGDGVDLMALSRRDRLQVMSKLSRSQSLGRRLLTLNRLVFDTRSTAAAWHIWRVISREISATIITQRLWRGYKSRREFREQCTALVRFRVAIAAAFAFRCRTQRAIVLNVLKKERERLAETYARDQMKFSVRRSLNKILRIIGRRRAYKKAACYLFIKPYFNTFSRILFLSSVYSKMETRVTKRWSRLHAIQALRMWTRLTKWPVGRLALARSSHRHRLCQMLKSFLQWRTFRHQRQRQATAWARQRGRRRSSPARAVAALSPAQSLPPAPAASDRSAMMEKRTHSYRSVAKLTRRMANCEPVFAALLSHAAISRLQRGKTKLVQIALSVVKVRRALKHLGSFWKYRVDVREWARCRRVIISAKQALKSFVRNIVRGAHSELLYAEGRSFYRGRVLRLAIDELKLIPLMKADRDHYNALIDVQHSRSVLLKRLRRCLMYCARVRRARKRIVFTLSLGYDAIRAEPTRQNIRYTLSATAAKPTLRKDVRIVRFFTSWKLHLSKRRQARNRFARVQPRLGLAQRMAMQEAIWALFSVLLHRKISAERMTSVIRLIEVRKARTVFAKLKADACIRRRSLRRFICVSRLSKLLQRSFRRLVGRYRRMQICHLRDEVVARSMRRNACKRCLRRWLRRSRLLLVHQKLRRVAHRHSRYLLLRRVVSEWRRNALICRCLSLISRRFILQQPYEQWMRLTIVRQALATRGAIISHRTSRSTKKTIFSAWHHHWAVTSRLRTLHAIVGGNRKLRLGRTVLQIWRVAFKRDRISSIVTGIASLIRRCSIHRTLHAWKKVACDTRSRLWKFVDVIFDAWAAFSRARVSKRLSLVKAVRFRRSRMAQLFVKKIKAEILRNFELRSSLQQFSYAKTRRLTSVRFRQWRKWSRTRLLRSSKMRAFMGLTFNATNQPTPSMRKARVSSVSAGMFTPSSRLARALETDTTSTKQIRPFSTFEKRAAFEKSTPCTPNSAFGEFTSESRVASNVHANTKTQDNTHDKNAQRRSLRRFMTGTSVWTRPKNDEFALPEGGIFDDINRIGDANFAFKAGARGLSALRRYRLGRIRYRLNKECTGYLFAWKSSVFRLKNCRLAFMGRLSTFLRKWRMRQIFERLMRYADRRATMRLQIADIFAMKKRLLLCIWQRELNRRIVMRLGFPTLNHLATRCLLRRGFFLWRLVLLAEFKLGHSTHMRRAWEGWRKVCVATVHWRRALCGRVLRAWWRDEMAKRSSQKMMQNKRKACSMMALRLCVSAYRAIGSRFDAWAAEMKKNMAATATSIAAGGAQGGGQARRLQMQRLLSIIQGVASPYGGRAPIPPPRSYHFSSLEQGRRMPVSGGSKVQTTSTTTATNRSESPTSRCGVEESGYPMMDINTTSTYRLKEHIHTLKKRYITS